jgi:ABC-type multidrug transport system ATPase subunit
MALKDVSVDFRPGMITGLVGDNGAGKSSLVKCLTGVLAPDKGYILNFRRTLKNE